MKSHFTELQTRNLEAVDESVATASDGATIDEPSRASITWQERQADVITFFLEFTTKGGVFFHRAFFACVAFDPASLSHRGGKYEYVMLSGK